MANVNQLFNFIQGSDITGESAYDIWRKMGYVGTEEDFLEFLQSGPQGPKGEQGAPAEPVYLYFLQSSTNVIKKGADNVFVPGSITFKSFKRQGGTCVNEEYLGRFVISETVDGNVWNQTYESSIDENVKVYNIVNQNTKMVKCELYESNGTINLLDTQSVAVLVDISNIEVGARNLILQSDRDFDGNALYELTLADFELQRLVGKDCVFSIFVKPDNFNPTDNYVEFINTWKNDIGELETSIIKLEFANTEIGERQKFNVNLVAPVGYNTLESITINLVLNASIEEPLVSRPKLELGKVATEWLPAPEDLQSIVAILNNESHTVVMVEGEVDYSECKSMIQVFYGSIDVTDQCTYEVFTNEGVNGNWDLDSHTFSVTEIIGNSGYVDINATYKNISITKRFNVSKVYTGEGLKGDAGKSTYDIWKELGNEGTAEDFLNSLKGQQGEQGLKGDAGKSTYDIWKELGNEGTAEDFLNSLKGGVKSGIGTNSEIFNDYLNNQAIGNYSHSEGMMTQAGSKAFSIIGYEYSRGGFTGGYLLDSAEGLEVGDVYSMHVCYKNIADENTIKSQQFINYGKIIGIKGPVTKADYEESSSYGLYIMEGIDSGYIVYVDKGFFIDDDDSLSFPDSFIDDNGIDNEKSTFRILQKPNIGTRLIGEYTHTEGINTIAMSKGGHAEGKDTRAEGSYGHAEGRNTKAWYCAHAEGKNTTASGENSHAEGINTLASLHAAHAEGCNSKAISYCTHAEGRDTTASNDSAHAEGNLTIASGINSHAEGESTKASGNCAHAEGGSTKASGVCSHAEGGSTEASGTRSHAEGKNTTASGDGSHAEGKNTTASGDGSHAEGIRTSATFGGAHAEGSQTNAINWNTHAEGSSTTASGDGAHAEGKNTTASGDGSHAEGIRTSATFGGAHAEGSQTKANNWSTHAEGKGTIASGLEQHVQGRYNVEDTKNKYADIIGNGTSETDRKNIHTVDWEGNGWYPSLSIGGTFDSNGFKPAFTISVDENGYLVIHSNSN